MHKVRVYVDTSVIGGTQDEEFVGPSKRFFERVRNGQYVLLVSPTTTGELEEVPPAVRDVMDTLPPACIEHVPLGTEVDILADAYIEAGALSPAQRADALHVAAATVAGADLILSWNFKHIVRYDRVRKFNGVNAIEGYRNLDIRSPMEIDYDPKTKIFDCVEMKRQAQEKLLAEYESRRDEFDSYSEFLTARSLSSAWQREFWAKVERAHSN